MNYSCEKKNTTNFISRESTLQGENRNPTFMAEKQELKDLRLIKYVATKNLKSQISSFLSDKFCFGSLWKSSGFHPKKKPPPLFFVVGCFTLRKRANARKMFLRALFATPALAFLGVDVSQGIDTGTVRKTKKNLKYFFVVVLLNAARRTRSRSIWNPKGNNANFVLFFATKKEKTVVDISCLTDLRKRRCSGL